MRVKLVQIANRVFSKMGYSLARIPKLEPIASRMLTNVFKSNFEKRVLISYILQPFTEGIKYHHTNYLECYTAAEAFHELGYAVDVVDLFDDVIEIEFNNYEIVYGLGISLEKAFYSANPERILKILYSTGCNPFYSYKTSTLQVQSFFSATGKLIPQSSRIMPSFFTFQYLLSDFVIALGNKFVVNTFEKINPFIKCESVNAFYFDIYNINLDAKNFKLARKNFLWFGSTGLLHKGLDLLIDIFAERNDITLHICGHTKEETKFWEYYKPITDNCSNIIDHDFVDIHSEEFKAIMQTCAFCVFPTASEGGSPSLLNVMANGGLIPLASKACGVDIDVLGYTFENMSKGAIISVINTVQLLTENELQEKSLYVKETIRKIYTYDNYKMNINQKIKKSIASFSSAK